MEVRLANTLVGEIAAVEALLTQARGNNAQTFEAYLKAGTHLATMKKAWVDAKGKPAAFNSYCEEKIASVTKQWRNRLIQLADHWGEIEPVVKDIPAEKLTVDGALSAWRKAKAPAAGEGEGEGEGAEAAPKNIKSLPKAELIELVTDLTDLVARFVEATQASDVEAIVELREIAREKLAEMPWAVVGGAEGQEEENHSEETVKLVMPRLPSPSR